MKDTDLLYLISLGVSEEEAAQRMGRTSSFVRAEIDRNQPDPEALTLPPALDIRRVGDITF